MSLYATSGPVECGLYHYSLGGKRFQVLTVSAETLRATLQNVGFVDVEVLRGPINEGVSVSPIFVTAKKGTSIH